MVDATPPDPVERATGLSTRRMLREVLLTGVAVLVPAAITLYVLFVIFGALAQLLAPVANLFPGETIVGQLLAGLALVGLVVVVGFVAHFRTGKAAIDFFDAAMGRVPGVGAVYRSFRRMSDIMLDSDIDHFRDVKLVSFPSVHAYMLGFVTTRTPDRVVDATDESGLQTLFVPLAPNPVMGGFVVHVPDEHVYDIDLTVEEGFRATVTGGVALVDGDGADTTFAGEPWELPERAQAAVGEVEDLRELTLEDVRAMARRRGDDLTLGDLRELELADLEERLFDRTALRDGDDADGASPEADDAGGR